MNASAINIVSGILLDGNKVLLGLRKNTAYYPGYWSLPVGHMEKGELASQTLKREMSEELGIEVINAVHFCTKTDDKQSIYHQVFRIEKWREEVVNLEPDLCWKLKWFLLDKLPERLTPVSREILSEL